MVDLDDIRRTLIACRDVPWSCACITPQELEALVEEVARLRGERAAVVAYLRDPDQHGSANAFKALQSAANEIERWGQKASVAAATHTEKRSEVPTSGIYMSDASAEFWGFKDIERGEHHKGDE